MLVCRKRIKSAYKSINRYLNTYFKAKEAPLCRFKLIKITTSHSYGISPNLADYLYKQNRDDIYRPCFALLRRVGTLPMPAKNNPNSAKTPIFSRFMPNSPSPVQQVRTKSPSTEIIENSDVLVACKYCVAFLG